MRVLIATDIHLHIQDGKCFLAKQIYPIIKRFHDAFGDIVLFSRESRSPTGEELICADDIMVGHIGFESLLGTMFGADKARLDDAIREADLVIGRFHSFSACEAARLAKKNRKPFLAEVMGDAWDGYWNHGLTGKLIAPFIFWKTKAAIRGAEYALYVTEHYLQDRYPCGGKTIHASNVELGEAPDSVLDQRLEKIRNRSGREVSLLTAANVDVRAKGHEYVIKALPLLNQAGIRASYSIAGGGDRSYLEKIARAFGVSEQLHFLGRLTADEVKRQMDDCDLYLQPSLQEGLPRSVIEAMSRGCPCLGAKTAGIPELLQEQCVFRRRSEKATAKAVIAVLQSDLENIARENFAHSKEYRTELLNQRRNRFFEQIKEETTS